jgi:hypothetical protein
MKPYSTAHGHPHPDAPEPPPMALEAAIDAALAALRSKTSTQAERHNAASNLAESWDHEQEQNA